MGDTILLIDDDQVLSMTLAKRLGKRNYQVKCTSRAVEGLKEATSGEYSLVICDLRMPEMSGNEVVREIRKVHEANHLPVIMLSASDDEQAIVECLHAGANDYVTKPVQIDVLLARIQTQINIVKLGREHARLSELKALTGIVITYNHEINNALAIAMGAYEILKKKSELNPDLADKVSSSLQRISDVVKLIDKAKDEDHLVFESYANSAKMLKIR